MYYFDSELSKFHVVNLLSSNFFHFSEVISIYGVNFRTNVNLNMNI